MRGLQTYGLIVTVEKWIAYALEKHTCAWIGHHVYKCGKCRKFFVHVYSLTEFDSECPGCHYAVSVRRATDED